MAKIENTTVYPTVTPAAEDLLIATDVSNNNETVTFLVSDLLGASTLQGLQSVLDVNNTATQNMILTGNATFNGTIIPTTITAGGGVGAVGQVLTSTGVGLQWSNVALNQNLQQTLDNGNSATGVDMNIDNGVINVTNGGVVLDPATYLTVGGVATFNSDVNLSTTLNFGATTTLSDSTGAVGTPGQTLTVNAAGTGVIWSSSAGLTPPLQDVLTAGNTANNIGIVMTGNGDFSTSATNTMTLGSANTYAGVNTFNSTVEINGTLEDGAGNFGTPGQVLAVNAAGTAVEWVNAASAVSPTLQIVLDNGNAAAQNINLTGDIDLTGQLYFQPASTINAGGSIGVNGQVLTSTGGGVQWSNVALNPTLNDVLTNGNTSALSINLTGSSTLTVPTLIAGAIQDNTGSIGSANQVLSVNSSGLLEWTAVAGASIVSFTVGPTATSTGSPLSSNTVAGAVTLTPNIYAGGANIGFVPAGGSAGQYLDGALGAWVNLPAGMGSFNITDGVTTESVGDSDNVTFTVGTPVYSAGTGLTATVSAPDTITFVNTGITGLSSTTGDIVVAVAADGQATLTFAGGGGAMVSWDIGDNSSTATVSNGNTVNIIGGTGITSTLSGTDITVATSAVLTETTAVGTSTGTPFDAVIAGNNIAFTSNSFAGGANVGHVPAWGGAAGYYLDGNTGAWTALPSVSAYTFDITDGTTTETVANADTVTFTVGTPAFSAGTGLTATVSNPDTVTLVNTGITNITAGADIGVSISATGEATISYTGGAAVYSWNIGDNSSTSAVTNGDTVNIIGGTGITSTLSGDDITIQNAGVLNIITQSAVANPGGAPASSTGFNAANLSGGSTTIQMYTYAGGNDIGLVPTGGTAGTVLAGDGTWVANAAGLASFNITGNTGSDTVDTLDNTLNILGTSPISTAVTATNNVTIGHESSGVSAGAYSYPSSVTVTAEGHVSAITAGSAPGTMNKWRIGASSPAASYYNIENDYFVSFEQGSGISTIRSGSGSVADPVEILISNTGVLDITGGAGISASASTGSVTLTNDGVLSLSTTDGTYIDLTPDVAATGAVNVTADLSATGTADATTFLRGDNTWATPTLSGTVVDSIQSSDGNITVTGDGGGPFTGNITLTYSGPTGTMSQWKLESDDGAASQNTIINNQIASWLGGTGITTSNAAGVVTITNDGVIDLTAIGAGISVSANTGSINISNTGVTSLIAGAGISLSGATGAVTITNTGTIGMTNWNLTADSGGTVTVDDAEYVTIAGGTNISTSIAGTGSAVDPFVLTIDSTSVVSGTQNYIAKFTNATTVGDSRLFDNGTGSVGVGTATTNIDSIGFSFASGIFGLGLQSTDVTTSFGVVNENDVTVNLTGYKLGPNNVLIAPTGLDGADASLPASFERNVIVGADASNTLQRETDLVVIGYGAAGGVNGLINGDVVIGSQAAAILNAAGGAGSNANVIIGRRAAYQGSIKRGVVVIGDNAAFSGVDEGSTIIGVEAAYNTAVTDGAVIIGQYAGGGGANSYTGDLSNSVVIGNNAQATGVTTQNFTQGILIGANSRSEFGASICIGVGVTNAAGTNTIHIGSATTPTGVVQTQVNTSSKYWPVYINGTLQKVLLA